MKKVGSTRSAACVRCVIPPAVAAMRIRRASTATPPAKRGSIRRGNEEDDAVSLWGHARHHRMMRSRCGVMRHHRVMRSRCGVMRWHHRGCRGDDAHLDGGRSRGRPAARMSCGGIIGGVMVMMHTSTATVSRSTRRARSSSAPEGACRARRGPRAHTQQPTNQPPPPAAPRRVGAGGGDDDDGVVVLCGRVVAPTSFQPDEDRRVTAAPPLLARAIARDDGNANRRRRRE